MLGVGGGMWEWVWVCMVRLCWCSPGQRGARVCTEWRLWCEKADQTSRRYWLTAGLRDSQGDSRKLQSPPGTSQQHKRESALPEENQVQGWSWALAELLRRDNLLVFTSSECKRNTQNYLNIYTIQKFKFMKWKILFNNVTLPPPRYPTHIFLPHSFLPQWSLTPLLLYMTLQTNTGSFLLFFSEPFLLIWGTFSE